MTIEAVPGEIFFASVINFPSGLTGTVRVSIISALDVTVFGPTSSGITEYPPLSGAYGSNLVAPLTSGNYRVFWDLGVVTPVTTAEEDLIVAVVSVSQSVLDDIALFTDASSEPVLSAEDLVRLSEKCARSDMYGFWPTDAGWTETYDIYYGVALGWLLKSSRLAGHYNFMTAGKMLSRQQFYDHCLKMYRLYSAKSGIKGIRLSPMGERSLGMRETPFGFSGGDGVITSAD